MNGPFVGQRIILHYLPASNLFQGEIIEVLRKDVRAEAHLCRVKLDSQDEPVGSVLYYDEPPEVVKSSLWQICWPAPKRIQRRRTKGWKMPEGAVYVGRPGKWGNPFAVKKAMTGWLVLDGRFEPDTKIMHIKPDKRAAALTAVNLFSAQMQIDSMLFELPFHELRGKNLACWCHLCDAHKDGKPLGVECPDCNPCHVDILLEMANS